VKAELTIESIPPVPAAPTMLAIAPISTIGYVAPYEVHELHILRQMAPREHEDEAYRLALVSAVLLCV
jgi:hypothetical protein